MWFSICIFCTLHLHKKESGVAFSSFLKLATTLTPRNIPTPGACNSTSAPKFLNFLFSKNHLFMKAEHRTLQNLLGLVRIVSSKKSIFSLEDGTILKVSPMSRTDFHLWITEAVDFPLGMRIKHESKSKKERKSSRNSIKNCDINSIHRLPKKGTWRQLFYFRRHSHRKIFDSWNSDVTMKQCENSAKRFMSSKIVNTDTGQLLGLFWS